MKKRMSILAVLVLAVAATAYSVSGTYAKYTSTAEVAGTAQVAKWAIVFKNGENTITDGATFNLGRTADTGVVNEKIAPGTTGSFNFGVNSTGTEVAFSYGISFTVADKPTHLKFYSDSTYSTEITPDGSGVYTVLATTNVAAGTAATPSQTVYWKWAFEDDPSTVAYDGVDTTEGVAAATMTVNATLTATQLDEAA